MVDCYIHSSEVCLAGLKAIVLSHLSKENNLPELAYETVRAEVTMSELPYGGGDFPLYVAKRSEVSEVICI